MAGTTKRADVAGSGMFVRVEVDESTASDAEAAKRLAGVCPVDIFADAGGRVQVVEKNLDECILCGLCLEVGPPGAVRVIKLYDEGALLNAH
jgi:NAD-dependent dihydropyrimidine dehydrogenase PreA subunit